MKFKQVILPLFVWMSFQPQLGLAQNIGIATDSAKTDTATYMIQTFEGGKFTGKILSQNESHYRVNSIERGILLIPKYTVSELTVVTDENRVLGDIMWPNPHPSRYFYSPSAFSLKKGSGYVSLSYFLLYQAQYGITDHISIGATTSLGGIPILFNIKADKKLANKLYGSIGGQVGKFTWFESSTLAVLFGNLTYGTKESNLTINTGLGTSNFLNNGTFKKVPIVTGSYYQRISNMLSFVGEFWMLSPENSSPIFIGGPGFRLFSGGKATWDFGFMGFSFMENYTVYNGVGSYSDYKRRSTYFGIPFLAVCYKL